MSPLPPIQQVDIATPIQNYYAAKQRNRQLDQQGRMQNQQMQMNRQGMQMNQMKMDQMNNPARILAEKNKKLNENPEYQSFAKHELSKIDPNSDDYNEQLQGFWERDAAFRRAENWSEQEIVAHQHQSIRKGLYEPSYVSFMKTSLSGDKPETKLGKLIKEREKLPADSPYRVAYDEMIKKLGAGGENAATPTDIDDYVADFSAQYQIDNDGKQPPPGLKNKARLEFKRAQAQEVKANTFARRNVEAATAENIARNSELGKQLAVIATAADVMEAKGEISPEQKKANARKGVSGKLAGISQNYMDLANMGAIVNVEKSSVENILASLRSSTIGQAFGKAIGTEEQSFRNRINAAKPLLLQDIRQSTDMGARGLDSEKELEFYLQAATDEKRDIQSNIAAIIVLDSSYGDGTLSEILKSKTTPELISEYTSKGQRILNKKTTVEVINPQTGEKEVWDTVTEERIK